MAKPDPQLRKIPGDLKIRSNATARVPQFDSTLGVPVAAKAAAVKHRLVTIGDSLTQGFKSGAIFDTDISWPMIVAWEMGWDDEFRRPRYNGFGGLPFNIEHVLHELERRHGNSINGLELIPALFSIRHIMDEMEDWWERGTGRTKPIPPGINHNLAVYGWDVRDMFEKRADWLEKKIKAKPASDDLFSQIIEHANEIAGLRAIGSARDKNKKALSSVEAAAALGEDGGIETFVVCIGANNALGAVTSLVPQWSAKGFDDLDQKGQFNVWHPDHFKAEYALLVAELKKVKAQHVLLGTVPPVTIAPITRGVGKKVEVGSRYFPHYTRPWIRDDQFDPKDDPHITEDEARAIDDYNDFITNEVRKARKAGLDWHLLEVSGILDRLASRRFIDDPNARPPWWTPWEIPPDLKTLQPPLTSRFFASGPQGRTGGGLFSLDGVHPTTVTYGMLAQEVVRIMQVAGVKFFLGDGTTERSGTVNVDFQRLLKLDSLMTGPPKSLDSNMALIGWLDQSVGGFFKNLF